MAFWLFFLFMTLVLPGAGIGSTTNCDAVLMASLVQEQCNGEHATDICCEVLKTIIASSKSNLPCLKMVIDQPELKYAGFTKGLLLDMAKSCVSPTAPPPSDMTADSVHHKDKIVDVPVAAASLGPKDRDLDVAKAEHEESSRGAVMPSLPTRDTESGVEWFFRVLAEVVIGITSVVGALMILLPMLIDFHRHVSHLWRTIRGGGEPLDGPRGGEPLDGPRAPIADGLEMQNR